MFFCYLHISTDQSVAIYVSGSQKNTNSFLSKLQHAVYQVFSTMFDTLLHTVKIIFVANRMFDVSPKYGFWKHWTLPILLSSINRRLRSLFLTVENNKISIGPKSVLYKERPIKVLTSQLLSCLWYILCLTLVPILFKIFV